MTTPDAAWDALVAAVREWANHMDQFEAFWFSTPYGPVYVNITRSTPWPDSYEELRDGGTLSPAGNNQPKRQQP